MKCYQNTHTHTHTQTNTHTHTHIYIYIYIYIYIQEDKTIEKWEYFFFTIIIIFIWRINGNNFLNRIYIYIYIYICIYVCVCEFLSIYIYRMKSFQSLKEHLWTCNCFLMPTSTLKALLHMRAANTLTPCTLTQNFSSCCKPTIPCYRNHTNYKCIGCWVRTNLKTPSGWLLSWDFIRLTWLTLDKHTLLQMW